jgi:CHAT domain-containing protein
LSWFADRFAMTRMPGLVNPQAFPRYSEATQRSAAKKLLAVGAPVGSGQEFTRTGSMRRVRALRSVDDIGHLPPLPNAENEMRVVANILGERDQKNAIFAGPRATKTAILKQLQANAYQVLLFSTHALAAGGVSGLGEPAILLTKDDATKGSDSALLRMSELIGQTLNVDMVVLSACSTASAAEDGSEPLGGLVGAFLAAGAKKVVASHWEVESDAAEQLITGLIEGKYRNNQAEPVALQSAARRMRLSKTLDRFGEHPVYWAAFEVVGMPEKAAAR